MAKRNPGVRVVYNRLLGGWYVVTGPHQTPLGGRFNSKEEAQASLRDRQAARDARAPTYRRVGWGQNPPRRRRRSAGSSGWTYLALGIAAFVLFTRNETTL